MKRHLGQ